MRLINVYTLETKDFPTGRPEYAILSHRWESGEITYQDYSDKSKRTGSGYAKIESFCRLVRGADWAYGLDLSQRLEWAWVDTCCIDKTSSAELSEAINSMWNWYQEATVCVAYISDCEATGSRARVLRNLRSSAWFRRGFILQELLAPKEVIFYAKSWSRLGSRNTTGDLRLAITLATSIEDGYLQGRKHVTDASIAQRMSWASARKTTRGEDLAYCLMGIFNVNMPLLYGEGQDKAFFRLQEQIVRQSNDESIFAFGLNMYGTQPALAANPRQFVDCEYVRASRRLSRPPYTITNAGLEFESPAIQWQAGRDVFYILNLNCGRLVHPDGHPRGGDLMEAVKLRGCIMVLRRIGDRFVRDFSWEKKVEQTSASRAATLLKEGTWQKIETMRFHLAVTVNDVYNAEIDERLHLLDARDVQKLWYEDNDGPTFSGFSSHDDMEQNEDDVNMPAFEDGEFEISDEEDGGPTETSNITARFVKAERPGPLPISLGPFELEA